MMEEPTKEQMEELVEAARLLFDVSEQLIPKIARYYRLLFEELRAHGFTEEQAISILAKAKMPGDK